MEVDIKVTPHTGQSDVELASLSGWTNVEDKFGVLDSSAIPRARISVQVEGAGFWVCVVLALLGLAISVVSCSALCYRDSQRCFCAGAGEGKLPPWCSYIRKVGGARAFIVEEKGHEKDNAVQLLEETTP